MLKGDRLLLSTVRLPDRAGRQFERLYGGADIGVVTAARTAAIPPWATAATSTTSEW